MFWIKLLVKLLDVASLILCMHAHIVHGCMQVVARMRCMHACKWCTRKVACALMQNRNFAFFPSEVLVSTVAWGKLFYSPSSRPAQKAPLPACYGRPPLSSISQWLSLHNERPASSRPRAFPALPQPPMPWRRSASSGSNSVVPEEG